MICAVCLKTDKNITNISNDCIIEYLEKIRLHYIDLKSQLDEKDCVVKELQATNKDLSTRLQLDSRRSKCSPKRRKTNSFDDSLLLSMESPRDNLNEAIKTDISTDESFFVGTQQQEKATYLNNILKPSNISPDLNTPRTDTLQLSTNAILPRRLNLNKKTLFLNKAPLPVPPVTVKTPENENRNPKWSSKETIKEKSIKLKGREWNMSFLQPPLSRKKNISPKKKSITPRKKIESCKKETSPNSVKNRQELRTEANLRQTRLNFNREQSTVPDTDETFCDDFITPSPTSLVAASSYNSKRKFERFLKYSIKKEPLSSVKKVLNLDAKPKKKNELFASSHQIKHQPLSSDKKAQDFDAKSKEDNESSSPPNGNESTNVSGIKPHKDNESSLCILSSQLDDIILIEETNPSYDNNIESETLFDEMMIESDETSDFLRNIENQRIQNLKNMQKKKNESANTSTCDKSAKNRQTLNCVECASYFRLVGRDLTDDELAKRMQKCTHNRRQLRQETPEGFWNPCFLPTQKDDPRNQILLDTRFVGKKT